MKRIKLLKTIVYILLAIIIISGLLFGYHKLFLNPYRQAVSAFSKTRSMSEVLTKKEALEDIDYLYDKLKTRHPLWLKKNNQAVATIEEKYIEVKNSINNEITVFELYKACSEILSLLHDGHTYAVYKNDFLVIDDFTQLESYGAPIKINGIQYDTVVDNFKKHSSYEYDFYIEENFLKNMCAVDFNLMLADVDVSNGVTFTYMENGKEKDYHYDFVPYEGKSSNNEFKWVDYEIDKENSIGIFTLKQCNYNDEYRNKVKEFFTSVNENGIANIIVDLRSNGGGNSYVANEFLSYLNIEQYNGWNSEVRYGWYVLKNKDIVINNNKQEPQFKGKLYVLTDVFSYSAAMNFAMLVKDNKLGTLIGEPCGNSPEGFGDSIRFILPNSHIGLGVSYKGWYRIDQSKAVEPIMPDIEVVADKALEKAYEVIKENK